MSATRNEWYWNQPIGLHIDNHSHPLGRGMTVDDISTLIDDLPVDIVQVAAFGNTGLPVNFPTELSEDYHDRSAPGWDTMAVWSEAVKKTGKRFHAYVNIMGTVLGDTNPDWALIDENGSPFIPPWHISVIEKPRPILCAKPDPDGDGYLERFFLPIIREVATKYAPGGFWIDGNVNSFICYCPKCLKAWRLATGEEDAPRSPESSGWARWMDLNLDRHDDMRKLIVQTIHSVNENIIISFNSNWLQNIYAKFYDDPRSPKFIDYSTRDLQLLSKTRLRALFHSAQDNIPYDTMHLASNDKPRTDNLAVSERRLLQMGATSLSCGGGWWIWTLGNLYPTSKFIQDRTMKAARFADDRKKALGKSTSMNNVGVLLSETSWLESKRTGNGELYDVVQVNNTALVLQEEGFAVDIINEDMLGSNIGHYGMIFVPNQRKILPETMQRLEKFVADGGRLVITGSALLDGPKASDEIEKLLGLKRIECKERMLISEGRIIADFEKVWTVDCLTAETLGRTGHPMKPASPYLTVNRLGAGEVIYIALCNIEYPDYRGVLRQCLETAGAGPSFSFTGTGCDRHYMVFFRKRHDHSIIIHLTDMTSTKGNRRIFPDNSEATDEGDNPVEEVTFEMPFGSAPDRVELVPEATGSSWVWEDGRLKVTLKGMELHCAIIISGQDICKTGFLPTGIPIGNRSRMCHY